MRDRSSYTPKHFPRKDALTPGVAPEPYRPKHFAKKVAVGITAASLSIGLAACSGEAALSEGAGSSAQEAATQLVSRISVTYGMVDGETAGPVYDFARDDSGNITRVTISGWEGGPSSSYECEYADGVLSGYELAVEGGDPDSVRYERDEDGRVTSELHSSYSVTYSYDDVGRLVSKVSDSRYVPYSRSYEYDADGNLLSSSLSNGPLSTYLTSYSYDGSGRLTSAQESSVDASGAVTDGVRTIFGYDDAGHLVSRTYEGPGSEAMVPATYEYDANGRVTSTSVLAREGDSYEASFKYDEDGNLSRLEVSYRRSGEEEPSGTTTYDIEYADVAGEVADSIQVGPNFGSFYSTDSVRLLEITPSVSGLVDPLPFQTDLSALI